MIKNDARNIIKKKFKFQNKRTKLWKISVLKSILHDEKQQVKNVENSQNDFVECKSRDWKINQKNKFVNWLFQSLNKWKMLESFPDKKFGLQKTQWRILSKSVEIFIYQKWKIFKIYQTKKLENLSQFFVITQRKLLLAKKNNLFKYIKKRTFS